MDVEHVPLGDQACAGDALGVGLALAARVPRGPVGGPPVLGRRGQQGCTEGGHGGQADGGGEGGAHPARAR